MRDPISQKQEITRPACVSADIKSLGELPAKLDKRFYAHMNCCRTCGTIFTWPLNSLTMLDEFCAVVFEGGARDILRESSGAKLKMAQVLFRVGFRLDTGIDIIVAESAQSLLHDKTEYKLNTEGG